MSKKPFHESIVEAISGASAGEMRILASLLRQTKVPNNHDQIIQAWTNRRRDLDLNDGFDQGLVEGLLEEKVEAEAKKEAEHKERMKKADEMVHDMAGW